MRSWCFDSVATTTDGVTSYDREYGSADIREVVGKLIGNGVYATPATNMQVVANTGLTVKVQPGCCWIKGAYGCVDTAETLTLETSSGGRTDLIVARFSTDLSYRSIRVMVVKGTDGNSAAPALTRTATNYDIQLAQIIVRSGASTISQSDITDMRFNKSVCGIVTGVVDQIDATDLFAQYNTAFNEKLNASQSTLDAKLAAFQSSFDTFFNSMQTTLSGDVAGNLLTLINNHTADKDNPHGVTKEQVGLENVLNEKQYCISNPQKMVFNGYHYREGSAGTITPAITVKAEDISKKIAGFLVATQLRTSATDGETVARRLDFIGTGSSEITISNGSYSETINFFYSNGNISGGVQQNGSLSIWRKNGHHIYLWIAIIYGSMEERVS